MIEVIKVIENAVFTAFFMFNKSRESTFKLTYHSLLNRCNERNLLIAKLSLYVLSAMSTSIYTILIPIDLNI